MVSVVNYLNMYSFMFTCFVCWKVSYLKHLNNQLSPICVATSRSSLAAFAALRCDGAVITWGSRPHGGENPEGRLFSTETLIG